MGKVLTAKAFVFFMFLLLSTLAQAQHLTDGTFLSSAKKNAYKYYDSALGDQVGLLNGSEYVEHYDFKNPKGFPYFMNDDWFDGTIQYDSGHYTNVGLMYDLVTDKVVLDMTYSHFKMELVSEKVKSFDIAGHHFVRVVKFKNDSSFQSGFYDVLYDGKVKAYARRSKERKEVPKISGIEVEYPATDHYYLYRNHTFYKVRSKRSVLAVFEDKKKELRLKMREVSRKINFRNDREGAIILVCRLYDEFQP